MAFVTIWSASIKTSSYVAKTNEFDQITFNVHNVNHERQKRLTHLEYK